MNKMNIKKGYKRLNMNMTSKYGNMQYELNMPYHLKGKLKICNNGYHLCENMLDTVIFYDSKHSRLFEVEYNADNCIETENKLCSDYIKIIREIPAEEYYDYIKEYIKNNDIINEHWKVRKEVARQGYELDKLINDEDWCVRYEIAKQGYGLDKLINDKNWRVRCEVAKQGHGLDILINDEDYDVRYEVARHGFGLDKLINDKNWHVRCLAKQKLNELNNK